MSETLSTERLFQLLQDYEPLEIRKLYTEEIEADPELAAILQQFEQLDQDLDQLAALQPSPEPDWQRLRQPSKPGLLLIFQRFGLPIAAILVLGLALSSRFWQSPQPQTQPSLSEDAGMHEPVTESPIFAEPSESHQSAIENEAEAMASADTASAPPVAQSPQKQLELSETEEALAAEAKAETFTGNNSERRALAVQAKRQETAGAPQPQADYESVAEPIFESEKVELAGESKEVTIVMRNRADTAISDSWQCWQNRFEQALNGTLKEPLDLFSEGIAINWPELSLKAANRGQFFEALAEFKNRNPDGDFTIEPENFRQNRVTVSWTWRSRDSLLEGVWELNLTEDCKVVQWQNVQD